MYPFLPPSDRHLIQTKPDEAVDPKSGDRYTLNKKSDLDGNMVWLVLSVLLAILILL